jgi:NADPH2:quinone reductase
VFVLGATGAVGGAAVQLAKAMGARLVLAGVSSPKRFAATGNTSADGIVDLSLANPFESIRRQVFAATDGAGVDVVIDPLGGDLFDGALRAIAWRGRMVVVGFAAGRIPIVKANYLMLKNIDVSGLQISDYRRRLPELMGECYRELFELYEAGKIRALSATARPLGEWKEALQAVETRTATSRLVLLPR